MTQAANTKTYYVLDRYFQPAFLALFQSLCSTHQDWWEKRKRSDDYNRTPNGAQTRNLIALFADSMAKDEKAKGRRILFERHQVRQRLFHLACYLRECCNKYRYDQPNQNEELADFLLFDEFLRELLALTDSVPEAVAECRSELSKQIGMLLQDVAAIRDISLPVSDDAPIPAVDASDTETISAEPPTGVNDLLEAVRDVRTSTDLMGQAIGLLRSDFDALREEMRAIVPASSPGNGMPSSSQEDEGLGSEEWDWPEEEVEDRGSLSSEEVRSRLVALRRQMWNDLDTGPSADGALRKRILDALIRSRITSMEQLQRDVPEAVFIDERQRPYLTEAFRIVTRMA